MQCSVCTNTATLVCGDCRDVAYCSNKCGEQDLQKHDCVYLLIGTKKRVREEEEVQRPEGCNEGQDPITTDDFAKVKPQLLISLNGQCYVLEALFRYVFNDPDGTRQEWDPLHKIRLTRPVIQKIIKKANEQFPLRVDVRKFKDDGWVTTGIIETTSLSNTRRIIKEIMLLQNPNYTDYELGTRFEIMATIAISRGRIVFPESGPPGLEDVDVLRFGNKQLYNIPGFVQVQEQALAMPEPEPELATDLPKEQPPFTLVVHVEDTIASREEEYVRLRKMSDFVRDINAETQARNSALLFDKMRWMIRPKLAMLSENRDDPGNPQVRKFFNDMRPPYEQFLEFFYGNFKGKTNDVNFYQMRGIVDFYTMDDNGEFVAQNSYRTPKIRDKTFPFSAEDFSYNEDQDEIVAIDAIIKERYEPPDIYIKFEYLGTIHIMRPNVERMMISLNSNKKSDYVNFAEEYMNLPRFIKSEDKYDYSVTIEEKWSDEHRILKGVPFTHTNVKIMEMMKSLSRKFNEFAGPWITDKKPWEIHVTIYKQAEWMME